MSETYLKSFRLVPAGEEDTFIILQKRTCYSGVYPFRIFPAKGLTELEFGPVTILYGGNGSGKSTLLNVMAEKLGVMRHSAFSGGAFFGEYVSRCEAGTGIIPGGSQILTSDDVFDYMLNIRYLNDGIDVRRNELLDEWLSRKYASRRFTGMDDYEDWKESYDAKSKSQSQYVRERLMRNVDMRSNGESAMKYFVDHIREDALYLLDEPENSLAVGLQEELGQYISDSARHFGCQFVLATHSPVLLSMPGAVIYDLDEVPARTKKWTELENVRLWFGFFERHRSELLGQ
ncbi:MAG: AAA family ATPase [Oscillospiraceae bacterium]|nr:AAA family ATPase [Oscillospiraceae bacterium]